MVSGSKANSASIHQSAAINSSRVVYAQEFDVSVTMLNIAIILYHIHEYARSLSVHEKLFQNIEPIEEQIALRVCLLLLDVALACEDISQASYLEKSLGIARAVGQPDSGSSTQQHSNQVLKFSITSNVTAPDVSTDSSNGNASENALGRTLPDESLEYETLYLTLDTGSKNMEAHFQ